MPDRKDSIETVVIPNGVTIMFCIYYFLGFFEGFLNQAIGSLTKYLLLLLIAIVLVLHWKSICFRGKYAGAMAAWFALEVTSLLWSNKVNMAIVEMHFISLVGMTLFFVVMTSLKFNTSFIRRIVDANLYSSALFGLLSLFFHDNYHGVEHSARQVLTLFGYQLDPNNCGAMLLIGIAIALYKLLVDAEKPKLNFAIALVNTYALFLTASRGALLSLLAILIVVIILPNNRNAIIWNRLKTLLIVIICASIIYCVAVTSLPQASFERLFTMDSYEGGSGRTILWQQAFNQFAHNPIFGCGWGGYSFGYLEATVPHNTYISLLCDTGLVGTALFFIPIASVVSYSFRYRYALPILLLVVCLGPAFFLDVINKRFFWNMLSLAVMLIMVKSNLRTKQSKLCVVSNLKPR